MRNPTMTSTASAHSLERFIYDKEFEISEALRTCATRQTFSLPGMARTQATTISRFAKHPAQMKRVADMLGDDLPHLASDRRSAACVYAKTATRIGLFANVSPVFDAAIAQGKSAVSIAICDHKDCRPLGGLNTFQPQTLLRRWQRVVSGLRASFPDLLSFAIVEISAAKQADGSILFEPHLHAILAGVPVAEGREAARSAISQDQPKFAKPLRVSTIYHLGGAYAYALKSCADLRLGKFLTGEVKNPKPNRIQGRALREWIEWHSQVQTSELFVLNGFSRSVAAAVSAGDLRADLDSLLKRRPGTAKNGPMGAISPGASRNCISPPQRSSASPKPQH